MLSNKSLTSNLITIFLIVLINMFKQIQTDELSESSSSFDSLISSQCKARCLSLYPWKSQTASNTHHQSNISSILLERKYRSSSFLYFGERNLNTNNNMAITKRFSNASESNHGIKWHKVMDMCSKNPNCLQCSLPCEIPTNLLSNCKYLCKNRHPLCIESCNLLSKLTDEKYGSCPSSITKYQVSPSLIASYESNIGGSTHQKCSNISKSLAIAHLIRNNHLDDDSSSANQKTAKPIVNECSKDSDCHNIHKCCAINPDCPEYGNVCQKPIINNLNLPSIPFNLTITERKKGKTVILSWDCVYNKNKPTIFVVEGRWSLKSPYSSSSDSIANNNNDNFMTKWGYLAQTTNNNWIILRSINRGRWYKFRVASISKSGTYGYSQPTELFILSSAPKPPSQPQNLTITQIFQTPSDSNTINADVSWLAPKRSDLPISEYKISWFLRPNNTQDESYFKTSEYDDSDEDSQDETNSFSNSESQIQSETSGFDIIDSQSSNKYTIKNLAKNSIYSVELVAISKYESKVLTSSQIRIRLDTSLANPVPVSSYLISDLKPESKKLKSNDYDDEEEDNYEDDDLENENSNSEQSKQQMIPRNSPLQAAEQTKIPLIKNLTVQTAYFQNGLVKAKLSWQIEQEQNNQQEADSYLSKQQASINSKTLIDQPMFTITWFAIKCVQSDKKFDTNLPTPITATTINTHFEIYELKYNCEYVVNVRLANSNKPLQNSQSSASSSSLNSNRPIVPQIASAQFKVPACSSIRIIGRIRPMCYDRNIVAENTDNTIETTTKQLPTESSTEQQAFEPEVYKLLFSSSSSSTKPITSKTSKAISSDYLATNSFHLSLPKINSIRYKIVEKIPIKNLYSIEFFWSLPLTFNRNLFSGYQISVVPKEIPGMGSSNDDPLSSGSYFGSVGAIVNKEQQSFIVRQLSPSIRYIFQIQTIGADGQSYGPASNLEFVIEDKSTEKSNTKKSSNSNNQINNNQINRLDYDLVYNEQNNDFYQPPSLLLSTSSSIPDYYQYSHSSSLMNSKFYFILNSVFLVLIQILFINLNYMFK